MQTVMLSVMKEWPDEIVHLCPNEGTKFYTQVYNLQTRIRRPTSVYKERFASTMFVCELIYGVHALFRLMM